MTCNIVCLPTESTTDIKVILMNMCQVQAVCHSKHVLHLLTKRKFARKIAVRAQFVFCIVCDGRKQW